MTLLFTLLNLLRTYWKPVLALVVLGGVFTEGFHFANKIHQLGLAQAEVATLKGRLATITLQQALDAKRAADDRNTLNTLERIARETPPNSGPCLDRAAVGRVRRIK